MGDAEQELEEPEPEAEPSEAAASANAATKPTGQGPAIHRRPVVFSNKLCKHGKLCWTPICPFRHPERESGGRSSTPSGDTKSLPPFKTRECWNWIKHGNCPYR